MGEGDVKYSFGAVVGEGCRVLVVGSLPGDESARRGEYYAHPRNVFWRVMGSVCGFDAGLPYEERLTRMKAAGVGLWDVVQVGVRPGSLDANIRDEQPNDIAGLLRKYDSIRAICCNGGAAFRFLRRYFPVLCRGDVYHVWPLPSTSPAAARLSYEEKRLAYAAVLVPLLQRP